VVANTLEGLLQIGQRHHLALRLREPARAQSHLSQTFALILHTAALAFCAVSTGHVRQNPQQTEEKLRSSDTKSKFAGILEKS
jgi:hypothetical protein